MKLWILDENLDTVEVITQFESLSWTKKWLTVGEFQLVISDKYDEIAAGKNNQLKIRYVYRADSDYVGRVDNIIYEDGMIIASGYFLEELLAFRYQTKYNITYSGTVEKVAHEIVNQNCIINKPISHLMLGENKNIGEDINATLFGKRIVDYLYELSTVHENSYLIRYDKELNKLVFGVLWGKDRTQEQTVNEWCLFGQQWGNVYSEKYETNTNYANYATVWGEGEDEDRVSVIVDIRQQEEELREITVAARDLRRENLSLAAYKQTLYDRGLQKLAEEGKFENILADVRVSGNMPYNLGDIVSIRHERTGNIFYMRITEEKETFEGSQITKKISFGERQGGVMTAISISSGS